MANQTKATKLQKFKVETVSRSQIQGAPYNPRQIDDYAKKRLRENIKRVGLLLPIVVNRRTKYVVSGHQRLAALDALEGSENYDLQVAYVELTDKQEREQVIFFNNDSAQGTYNVELLSDLIKDIDIELAGFTPADLSMILPDFEVPDTPAVEAQVADVVKQQEQVDKMKAQRKAAQEKYEKTNAMNFFTTLVFSSQEEMDSFFDAYHIERGLSYISFEKFSECTGIGRPQPKMPLDTKRVSKKSRVG